LAAFPRPSRARCRDLGRLFELGRGKLRLEPEEIENRRERDGRLESRARDLERATLHRAAVGVVGEDADDAAGELLLVRCDDTIASRSDLEPGRPFARRGEDAAVRESLDGASAKATIEPEGQDDERRFAILAREVLDVTEPLDIRARLEMAAALPDDAKARTRHRVEDHRQDAPAEPSQAIEVVDALGSDGEDSARTHGLATPQDRALDRELEVIERRDRRHDVDGSRGSSGAQTLRIERARSEDGAEGVAARAEAPFRVDRRSEHILASQSSAGCP